MTLRERLAAVAAEYQRGPRWIRSQEIGKMLDEWLSEEPDLEQFRFPGYPDSQVYLHPCGTVLDVVPGSDTWSDVEAGNCDCENVAPWCRIYVEKAGS